MHLIKRYPASYEIALRDNICQGDERIRRIRAVLGNALRNNFIIKRNDDTEKIKDNGID